MSGNGNNRYNAGNNYGNRYSQHDRDGQYIGSHRSRSSQSGSHDSRAAYRSRYEGRNNGAAYRSSGAQTQYRRPAGDVSAVYRHDQADRSRSGSSRQQYDSRPAPAAKSGKLKRLIYLCVVSVLAVLGLIYIASAVLLSGVNRVQTGAHWHDEPAAAVSDLPLRSGVKTDTVLFIGADGSGGDGSRSDTIMYASVNKAGGRLRLCSVLRDSYVEIPGHGSSKINSALAFGSDELCMRTMEKNFRIKTRKFIRVNMDAMKVVIDELGGVELTLTAQEAKAMNDHFNAPVAREGTQTLDGAYALYYARIRKIDDDFHRVSRQRTLLSAIASKCRKASPAKLCSAMNKAAPYVTTNMSSFELTSFGLKVVSGFGKDGGPEHMTVPVDGTWSYKEINGQSCISMNIRANAEEMQDFLFFRD